MPSAQRPTVSDADKMEGSPQPVMSSKLAQRIGQLKRRVPSARASADSSGAASIAEVAPLARPQVSEPPAGPSSTEKRERTPLYVSRSSSNSASFRLAQVSQQLQGLETALQVRSIQYIIYDVTI